jgi:hypothetical protein
MGVISHSPRTTGAEMHFLTRDLSILLLSIVIQLSLALLFGHFYDMRIFMATGVLVATGQNPYIPQDLTALFHNPTFQGMTTVGYPPPYPLVLGLIYRSVFTVLPNLTIYNLALKIPVIAGNVCLAYLAARILRDLGAEVVVCRRAWVFLLFNPFLLYFSAAWGQFDSVVALTAILSLVMLYKEKPGISAILLALAFSLKPTALPLLPVAFIYLAGRAPRHAIRYLVIFTLSVLLLCVAPFFIFGWSPDPILRGWNAHFTVGGGMSFMTFFELLSDSYQLPGGWWLLGLIWIPALGIATLALWRGIPDTVDLLKKSTALLLVFFLTRAWLSEPNIILVLPLVLILTLIGELDELALAAIWVLPLIFTLFNASLPQLLFLNFPGLMASGLRLAEEYRTLRLVARILVVIPWQIAGWWIVFKCYGKNPAAAQSTGPDQDQVSPLRLAPWR